MITKDIEKRLFELQDKKFNEFNKKLIPGMEDSYFIGVRTPALRAFAKEISKEEDTQSFLKELPHKYFDENQLHGFIISGEKDFKVCIEEVEEFLPYINNWATCDQTSPKVFKKHKKELLPYIEKWIKSEHTYTVRFAIGMLMQHYLDDDYDEKYPKLVAVVRSEEYYINMMIAWYFATALAKQYESILPYIEEKKLDNWTHNKAIQKACESYRITPEQKEYLKTFKIKKK
ncbi:MAG: DNA alkylation repair protein [Lachnospiraceae bacterium]|nr:DNA alkylation repair protein [Lachnospiraceae bacterium]